MSFIKSTCVITSCNFTPNNQSVQLQFSKYNFTIKTENDKQFIYDIIRRKYILLTPEEWVRQHIVHHILHDHKFPKALVSLEKQLFLNDMSKRTDIVLYNHAAKPVLIVECKAPEIKISQKTFEQIARYNLTLIVPYLWVTNGKTNYLCNIDHQNNTFNFLQQLPPVNEILSA
ncbi:MAG: type I restriction enzyme HsdR N-terminal domain-containing protein [Fimbriimonadaceae bacterium]|nr:type I restriction enzyme HsdR N-terminal domain-containing protein [Chitinophagales bacterium]